MTVKYIAIKEMMSIALLSAVVLSWSLWAGAQGRPGTAPGSPGLPPKMERQGAQSTQLEAGHPPGLSAKLVDPERKAQKYEATVEAHATGIDLVDPAKVNEQPAAG